MRNPFKNKVEKPTVQMTMDEIELLKEEVKIHFPFYDFQIQDNICVFFCNIDPKSLDEEFDSLRNSLSIQGYIPFLRKEHGESLIYITKKQKQKQRSSWINLILLIATIITTILTGSLLDISMQFSANYQDIQSLPNIMMLFESQHLINGALLFSLPLMSILFMHEMGHYYISKKHKIITSLPFFIPIPPMIPGFNIGTFGALISSNDPMPNKKALFDVGIAGPIVGFIIAIPVTIVGLITSEIVPVSSIVQGETVLGSSLLFMGLTNMFISVEPGFALNLSPIAFAGWIGLLITSINLLPAGQLDGGHIFRAVLGEKQKYAAWIAIFVMVFTGWVFFAIIVMFLIGTTHPPPLNDDSKLDTKRKLIFFIAIAILIICFIPNPIYIV
jgi:Zn-dependent protease